MSKATHEERVERRKKIKALLHAQNMRMAELRRQQWQLERDLRKEFYQGVTTPAKSGLEK